MTDLLESVKVRADALLRKAALQGDEAALDTLIESATLMAKAEGVVEMAKLADSAVKEFIYGRPA